MKIKSIEKIIGATFNAFTASITDDRIRGLVEENAIITGGCIPSMLMKEKVNDFDIYFRTIEVAVEVAKYYVALFKVEHPNEPLVVDTEGGRVRCCIEAGKRGTTTGNLEEVRGIYTEGQIEDVYSATKEAALEVEDKDEKYLPVFISTNAITLTGRIQLVLRFQGEPDEIHKNYDFVHCTNYWTSWDDTLVLRQAALESILSKELIYVGSKYPLCSIIRIRKFVARGWSVNAGQILKMILQCQELDLKDPKVLEDQLTGVDSAYFAILINQIDKLTPDKLNAAYLCEIINRIF